MIGSIASFFTKKKIQAFYTYDKWNKYGKITKKNLPESIFKNIYPQCTVMFALYNLLYHEIVVVQGECTVSFSCCYTGRMYCIL